MLEALSRHRAVPDLLVPFPVESLQEFDCFRSSEIEEMHLFGNLHVEIGPVEALVDIDALTRVEGDIDPRSLQ